MIIIVVVVVILLLEVTITIKDIVMKLNAEKKKQQWNSTGCAKSPPQFFKPHTILSYYLFALLHTLSFFPLSHLFNSTFFISHCSLHSLYQKKRRKKTKKKKNKQTPIRDIYLNSISSPLEKVKKTPIDIVMNKIFMTGQRCKQSITAPLAPIPQLFSLSIEYINYQRMPFLSVFFLLFQDNFDPIKKAAATTPDTAMVAKFVTDQNLHAIHHLIIVCFFSLFFSLSLCSIFLVAHWQLLSSTL